MIAFSAFADLGGNRFRERGGLDFEDFAAGQVFHHRPGITATQRDNVEDALLSHNQAMIHFDHHYSSKTEFKHPLVVSTVTIQRAIGMAWKTFGLRKRILGWPSIRMTAPVFDGDTLYSRSQILGVEAGDDPDAGLLHVETIATNQDGATVCQMRWDVTVYRRAAWARIAPAYAVAGAPAATAFGSHMRREDGELVEKLGVEFDELAEGQVFEHRPPFVFSWQEVRLRALLGGDHAAVVLDPSLTAQDGRPAIAEYWMLNVTAAVTTRTFGRVVANLQWEPIRVEGIARDGDLLFVESEILGKRTSSSRPDQGIAHVAARARLQDGTPVLSFERRFLMYLSPAGPHSAAGYV